jgi:hydrogenase/urease accessory protein HupE
MRRRHQVGSTGVLAAVCVTVLLLSGGTLVRAHEIGTTRVLVLFEHDRTYRIEVVTDAASLVDKLSAATGVEPPAATNFADLQTRLQAFDDVFRRRLAVSFDESTVRPAIEYSVLPPGDATSSAVAAIRLRGEIPRSSSRFAWSYGWTFASYALIVRNAGADGATTEWLEGSQISKPVSLTTLARPVTRIETALRYLALGFTHIVPKGLDHMLFVLGVFLLTRRLRPVLWQVSAFTVAHSITLGLSIYGVISVAPALVEPLIALSIAYVAIENLFMSELKPWRVALVFAFGLLHGMGFAGALKELGLPRSEFMTALLTFNLGVEAGQLAVIGAAFLIVGWYCGNRVWYRRRVVVPASAVIACIAVYWTIQRL